MQRAGWKGVTPGEELLDGNHLLDGVRAMLCYLSLGRNLLLIKWTRLGSFILTCPSYIVRPLQAATDPQLLCKEKQNLVCLGWVPWGLEGTISTYSCCLNSAVSSSVWRLLLVCRGTEENLSSVSDPSIVRRGVVSQHDMQMYIMLWCGVSGMPCL